MFNESERLTLRQTTFRDIIVRNLEIDGVDQFIRNIWMIQPPAELDSENSDVYKTEISPWWTLYSIKYYLDNTRIHFKVELQTAGGEGWFGMVSTMIMLYIPTHEYTHIIYINYLIIFILLRDLIHLIRV